MNRRLLSSASVVADSSDSLSSMTTETKELKFTKHQLERALVSRADAFEDFISLRTMENGVLHTVVKITEPPDAFGQGGGVIDFEMWENLREMVQLLGKHRLLSVMKARQVGLSWLIGAYALWKAQYFEGSVVLIFSQGQGEATALLGKIHSIWNNLPEHLKEPIGLDNSTTIEFPAMKSKIVALPSTEKAGRSETASLVIQDEADFHDNIEENFAAVKPTIDGGGQLIQISTVNKKKMLSMFKEIYRKARRSGDETVGKTNGFVSKFFSWKVRPSRDQAWYDQIETEAPDTAEMSAKLYMEQEYPNSEEEALRPSRVMAAFDQDVLDLMLANFTSDPVETEENGLVRIWQKATPGRRYVAFSDTAHGTGGDNAVTCVMDVISGMIVADVKGNLLNPQEFARISVNLLHDYSDPLWGIEDNDWGITTIRTAQEMRYRRLYERKTPTGKDSGNIGWHTDEKSRYTLYGELIEAIHKRLITIPARDGVAEFMTVIRNPQKAGRIEALIGTHDDYPLAVGGCWQLRKDAAVQTLVTEIYTIGDDEEFNPN
jgi:hypothetical protein